MSEYKTQQALKANYKGASVMKINKVLKELGNKNKEVLVGDWETLRIAYRPRSTKKGKRKRLFRHKLIMLLQNYKSNTHRYLVVPVDCVYNGHSTLIVVDLKMKLFLHFDVANKPTLTDMDQVLSAFDKKKKKAQKRKKKTKKGQERDKKNKKVQATEKKTNKTQAREKEAKKVEERELKAEKAQERDLEKLKQDLEKARLRELSQRRLCAQFKDLHEYIRTTVCPNILTLLQRNGIVQENEEFSYNKIPFPTNSFFTDTCSLLMLFMVEGFVDKNIEKRAIHQIPKSCLRFPKVKQYKYRELPAKTDTKTWTSLAEKIKI